MITYGFFNSLNGDRVYNADQVSNFLSGIVSANGVFYGVGNRMQVTAATGMTVNVANGRCMIDHHWLNNDAAETVTITAAHPTYNRYTAVVVQCDYANRLMEITTVDGSPGATPTKPAMTNTSLIKQICLAYVYVPAGSSVVLQANIQDARPSSDCGWITGVIDQVDISDLVTQWESAYQAYYNSFQQWFAALTQQLNVNTFLVHFDKHTTLNGSSTAVALDMTGYTYQENDVVNVYINGLYAVNTVDYTLSVSGNAATITGLPATAGTVIDIQVFRSQIGFYMVSAGNDEAVGTENDEAVSG